MYRLKALKIKNFRSFLDEQKLDLDRSNITAIYGANASGKSNTALALSFLKWFILNSARAEVTRIPFEPFCLRDGEADPTFFEIEFFNNGKTFRYSFSFIIDEVVSEELVDLTSQKEKVIFRRERQEIKNIATAKKFGFTENLLSRTRNTTLLITKAREDNNVYANILFDFMLNLNVITCGTPELRNITIDLLKKDPTMRGKVLKFLRNADFWIRDFRIDDVDTPDEVMKTLPFTEDFKKNFQKAVSITTMHSIRDTEGKVIGATQLSLDSQESRGTIAIFDLAALIIYSIEQKGCLYIDEFGIHLHPDICSYILDQFRGDKEAQLIFNTHDTSLMSRLKREEIVFVDKNQAEQSFIIPLKTLSVRVDDPFEKHYRKGIYGARPLVRES